MVAPHRLMVRCPDDDTHAVGSRTIFRIIGIKSPSPHGRPHEIAAQTQYELKHSLIEPMVAISCPISILNPSGQAGSLVIEEYSTIFHSRLPCCVCALLHREIIVMANRHISPVIPW